MTRLWAAVLPMLRALVLRAQTPATSMQPQSPPGPVQSSPGPVPYTLQTGAKLVLVPATVAVKGQILYGLKADQFEVTDDGVPEKVTLDEQVDALGLSLVVVLQCSRSAVMEYGKIEALPDLLSSLVGGAPHEIALVRYGSQPELVQPFTRKLYKINESMRGMGPCEDGRAATIDAVSYAASILENRPERYRRAILLVGETRDHGSKVKERDVIAQLGRNNIVVNAFAFSPYRDSMKEELKPGGGSGLLPNGINLLLAAVQALRDNAPKTMARLSGGDYDNFGTSRGFADGVGRLTNRIHNFYLLSFPVPNNAEGGLHEIRVRVPEYPEANIRARRDYWAGEVPSGP